MKIPEYSNAKNSQENINRSQGLADPVFHVETRQRASGHAPRADGGMYQYPAPRTLDQGGPKGRMQVSEGNIRHHH